MSKMKRVAAGVAAFAAFGSPAWAHHPGIGGSGGSGPIVTIPADTLEQGQLAFATMMEYIRTRQLGDATLLATAGQEVHGLKSIESYSLSVAYGITDNLTIMAKFPWVRRTGIREGELDPPNPAEVINRGTAAGPGDMTVLGQYRFLNNIVTGTQLALLFGFKLPTGASHRIDASGELFGAEFQPGSGSVDMLVGAALSQRMSSSWSLHANVLYVLTGNGTQETNLGNRFLYNTAAVFRLFGTTASEPHSHGVPPASGPGRGGRAAAAPVEPHTHLALDGILEFNGEWHAKERTAGVPSLNSGGNTIYVSPGLRLTVENWAGFMTFGIPIVNNLNGIQAKPDWRLLTGMAVALGH